MQVKPGTWYVVTTDSSCTVTDANGKTLCTAVAGTQTPFLATTMEVTLSDSGATITKSTFNAALALLGQSGGGGSSELLPGFTRLEYLESTGAQSIVTDCYISSASGVEIALDCELLNGGYTEPVLCGVVPTANGTPWGLGLYYSQGVVNFSPFNATDFNWGKTVVVNTRNTFVMKGVSTLLINGVTEDLRRYGTWSSSLKWDTAKPLTLFSTAKPDRSSYALAGIKAKMFKTTISVGGTIEREFVPALDPAGEPCLFDLVNKRAFKNSGSGQFTAGLANIGALSNILLALPYHETAGSKLHVRLPDGANMDEAKRIANLAGELKNWQITYA